MPLYAIYTLRTINPHHVVVTEDGEPYAVPNSHGGWKRRRPFRGHTIDLAPLRPKEQRLMLIRLGVVDRHGDPIRTGGVDECGFRTDLFPDEPAGPIGGDDTL